MSRKLFSKKHVFLLSSLGLGGCYVYTKPAPLEPYVPPPFHWSSIPSPILSKFRLPEPKPNGIVWECFSTAVVGGAGSLSKLFLKASDLKVVGLEKFLKIVDDPNRTQGLITVSNHESVLDDPVLWGVLPLHILFNTQKMRWVLGAADICYTSLFKSYFFVLGQTIPTIRGGGIYQPGMDFAIHKLQHGGWVHLYPEAKVVQTGKMIRFKWGIGRLLMDTPTPLIVIPIWHEGMRLAKPLYETKLIHLGKPITLVFGDPIDYQDIVLAWKDGQLSTEEARIKLTDRVYQAIDDLRIKYSNTPL